MVVYANRFVFLTLHLSVLLSLSLSLWILMMRTHMLISEVTGMNETRIRLQRQPELENEFHDSWI